MSQRNAGGSSARRKGLPGKVFTAADRKDTTHHSRTSREPRRAAAFALGQLPLLEVWQPVSVLVPLLLQTVFTNHCKRLAVEQRDLEALCVCACVC